MEQDKTQNAEIENNTIKDLIIKLDRILIKKEIKKSRESEINSLIKDLKSYSKYRINEGKIRKEELHNILSQLSSLNVYSKRILENNYFKLITLNPRFHIDYPEGKTKQGKIIRYDREKQFNDSLKQGTKALKKIFK